MSVLERWLPFMFRRKSAEDKKSEPRAELPVRVTSRRELGWPSSAVTPWVREMLDEPFWSEPSGAFRDIERWFGDFTPDRFTPRVDVTDEDDVLKITAELPGMQEGDIDLSIDNGVLTIRGEKRHEEEKKERGAYRTERYYGYVQRTLPLPEDVDDERTEAEFDRGVLTVRVPKKPSSGRTGRRIAIRTRP